MLSSTRSEAISRNREFQVHYDLDEHVYRVRTPYKDGGGFAAEDDERLWISETPLWQEGISIAQVTVDDEVFTSGKVFVRFDALGTSSNHTVTLSQDIFERVFTVEVLPLTGDIRFHTGFFERDPPKDEDFE